jgi:hypothetical protein
MMEGKSEGKTFNDALQDMAMWLQGSWEVIIDSASPSADSGHRGR